MRKRLLKLSLVLAIIGAAVFAVNYFFFHYVTDAGITLVWHAEAGKPFVTNLIGMLGVDLIFGSIVSLVASFVMCDADK